MGPRNASDVHLTLDNRPAFRIHGKLETAVDLAPVTHAELEGAMKRILTKKQLDAFEDSNELDFALNIPGAGRFRGNIAMERGALTMVFRRITELNLEFESLGLPALCRDLALKPRGLVIVTGTVGSGKSTTLAAMISYLNTKASRRIVTLEDPIEYAFQNDRSIITQRQVGNDTPSFASALSHVLRQNPDVIMVGETRDTTTVGAALSASETGHLVLTTAHAPSAPLTIDRIIDMFEPHHQQQVRAQLALILEAVLYQQLIPRADGKGRVLAVEVMLGTPAIRNLIREGKTHQLYSTIQLSSGQGMQTLDQSIVNLYRKGLINEEGALSVCENPEQLMKDLRTTRPVSVAANLK